MPFVFQPFPFFGVLPSAPPAPPSTPHRYEKQSPNLRDDYVGSTSAVTATGIPSSATDGLAFPSQQAALIVQMRVFGVAGVDAADFRVWLYRIDSGKWLLWGDAGTTTVIAGGPANTEEVRGVVTFADRVYVEVLNVVGAPFACRAWTWGATAPRGV